MTQTLEDIMSQMTLNKVDHQCQPEIPPTRVQSQQSHCLVHCNPEWRSAKVSLATKQYENQHDNQNDKEGDYMSTKRLDFISLLPFEIASAVLQRLTIGTLLESIKVNHEWYARIMNTPSLWHEITVTDDQDALIPMLTHVGKHVRSYMIYNGGPNIIAGSLNIMFYGCMSNIKSLTWENCLCDEMDILDALQYLSGSLTELTLYADQDHFYSPPHYLSILRTCPNLKRLNVALPHSHMDIILDDPPVSPNDNLKLTHLNWTTGSSLVEEDIHPLLYACPDLRYLQIGCFTGEMSIFFNPEVRPSLRYLSIDDFVEGYEPDVDYWDDDDYYYDDSEEEEDDNNNDEKIQDRLQALTIYCTNARSWEIIKEILSREKNVLEKLTVYHDYEGFDAGYLIQNFRGKWLTFYGSDGGTNCAELDATLISHDEDDNINNNNDVISPTGTSFPRLWHIHSTYNQADNENQVASLIMALKNKTSSDNNKTSNNTTMASHRITRLRLAKGPVGGEIILPLLLELPSLQVLKLEQCIFYTQTLVQFAKQLASRKRDTSALNYLGFSTVCGLTDEVVMELASVSGLKRIKLWHCDYLTDKSIHHLVDQSESDLEDLDLFQCKQVTWDTINHVQDVLETRRL
ncbi:hypothetical protein BDA99DRAFT_541516 [Phascolomyces articulosus]|uniref:F-box domain-containing protein n=1 Tax=Phascolomyces articulosus TaxID=60185 RepID=A0AAD5PA82_9FUNG|nr:hypothetical protein BDA99DRAFT_541516 [Phascolomyces articulosus]